MQKRKDWAVSNIPVSAAVTSLVWVFQSACPFVVVLHLPRTFQMKWKIFACRQCERVCISFHLFLKNSSALSFLNTNLFWLKQQTTAGCTYINCCTCSNSIYKIETLNLFLKFYFESPIEYYLGISSIWNLQLNIIWLNLGTKFRNLWHMPRGHSHCI